MSTQPKSAKKPVPAPRSRLLAILLLIAALAFLAKPAHPQGCTQCLDNTASTPPKTQAAYRHAIVLLTLTAGGVFLTTLALFKRHR